MQKLTSEVLSPFSGKDESEIPTRSKEDVDKLARCCATVINACYAIIMTLFISELERLSKTWKEKQDRPKLRRFLSAKDEWDLKKLVDEIKRAIDVFQVRGASRSIAQAQNSSLHIGQQ